MKRALITPTIAALATVGLAFTAAADTPVPPPTERVSVEQINTCDDLEVTVYFAAHDAMMSSYSYRTIEAASDQLSECAVTSIEARVISEEAHTDESLAKLSEARANAVLQALKTNGIRSGNISTEIADAQATKASLGQPLARRVDVTLTAVPALGT